MAIKHTCGSYEIGSGGAVPVCNCTEPQARFFIDHGMIHDRETGRHVTTNPDEDTWAGMTITETCALLNKLAG